MRRGRRSTYLSYQQGMVLAVLGTIVVALYALSSYKEATSFLALVVWAFSALSLLIAGPQ